MGDLVFEGKRNKFKLSKQNLRDIDKSQERMQSSGSNINLYGSPADKQWLSQTPKETEVVFVNGILG